MWQTNASCQLREFTLANEKPERSECSDNGKLERIICEIIFNSLEFNRFNMQICILFVIQSLRNGIHTKVSSFLHPVGSRCNQRLEKFSRQLICISKRAGKCLQKRNKQIRSICHRAREIEAKPEIWLDRFDWPAGRPIDQVAAALCSCAVLQSPFNCHRDDARWRNTSAHRSWSHKNESISSHDHESHWFVIHRRELSMTDDETRLMFENFPCATTHGSV